MKKISTAFIFVFSLIMLSPASASSQTQSIAPAGQKLIDVERDKYPDFDALKAETDAKQKFPIIKEGTEISVNYKRNVAKGKFYGIEGRFAKIGTSRVPLMDLPFDMLCKLSKEKNAEERKKYVSRQKSSYYRLRKEHLDEVKKKISAQYPLLEDDEVRSLFHNIDDEAKVKAYTKEVMDLFEKKLPLKKSIEETKKESLARFLNSHSELLYEDDVILDKAKVEAEKKGAEEKKKRLLARKQARKLFPKTAAPVFEPDGGDIKLEDTLVIKSPTKDAVIHYTLDGTIPDFESPVYKEPIPLKKVPKVKAIAVHPEYKDSDVVWSLEFRPPGGLFRSYYSYMDFTGPTFTQIDPVIDFYWGAGEMPHNDEASGKQIPWLMNSALWTGQIIPEKSEEYTLYLTADDAARLWLNGKLVLSTWNEQGPTEVKRSIKLKGGTAYHIKIAFVELFDAAKLKLEWSSETTSRQVVPSTALKPDGKYTDIVKKWNDAENKRELTNPGAYKGTYSLKLKTTSLSRKRLIYSTRILNSRDRSNYASKTNMRSTKERKDTKKKSNDTKKKKKINIRDIKL